LVNHAIEPVDKWWQTRAFARLILPEWLRDLRENIQPLLLALQAQIRALTFELQESAAPGQPRGATRYQSCVTKHGNPRLRAALVELAWRLVRFQPNYKPIVKWRQTLTKGALASGPERKKAIVAVARQLALDLWRIRTGRLTPETLGFTQ
jgi:hypothetical protein